jgi:hypothetical protein
MRRQDASRFNLEQGSPQLESADAIQAEFGRLWCDRSGQAGAQSEDRGPGVGGTAAEGLGGTGGAILGEGNANGLSSRRVLSLVEDIGFEAGDGGEESFRPATSGECLKRGAHLEPRRGVGLAQTIEWPPREALIGTREVESP